MPIKFSVKFRVKDLYLFNLYHTYTSLRGLFTIIIGIVLIVVVALRADDIGPSTLAFYGALVLAYILYNPIILYMRSKQRIFASEVFSEPLSFEVDEEGIRVSSPAVEEPELLSWNQIYKVKATRNYVYVFTNTVNAYILPKEVLAEKLGPFYELCQKHIEAYRLSLKG